MKLIDLQVHTFFLLRMVLGVLSAATEAALVSAAGRLGGNRLGAWTLLLLCFASGCFTASTSRSAAIHQTPLPTVCTDYDPFLHVFNLIPASY